MAYRRRDEDLAYGEDHARDHGPDNTGAEGERGIFGGRVSQRLFGGQQQHPPQGSVSNPFCLVCPVCIILWLAVGSCCLEEPAVYNYLHPCHTVITPH